MGRLGTRPGLADAGFPRLDLFGDGVDRPALDVALNAAEVLADEGEDEALDAEDEEDREIGRASCRERV